MYMPTRTTQWILLPVLLATLMPFAWAEPASPQVREQIVSLSQQLMDAVGEGKPQVWNRIVVDDAVIVDEFGRRQTKKEIIAGLHPFPAGISGGIQIRNPRVRVYGDIAVLVCEEYEHETAFGQKFVVRYIATNTFVRRDGTWRLVAMQDVTLPTAPPKLKVTGLRLQDYPGIYSYGPNRAWSVALHDGVLSYSVAAGRPPIGLDPIAKDVFMEDNDERNLLIFHRDASGRIVAAIELRKFNELKLTREDANT